MVSGTLNSSGCFSYTITHRISNTYIIISWSADTSKPILSQLEIYSFHSLCNQNMPTFDAPATAFRLQWAGGCVRSFRAHWTNVSGFPSQRRTVDDDGSPHAADSVDRAVPARQRVCRALLAGWNMFFYIYNLLFCGCNKLSIWNWYVYTVCCQIERLKHFPEIEFVVFLIWL